MEALDQLTELLPKGAVSTHPGEVVARARDWWALAMLREARGEAPVRPIAAVFPRSTEDVATILRWSSDQRIAVVPRGGGSGVCGAAMAVRGAIVLDLSRMDRVLSVDEESLAVEVEAGIHGDRLEAALAERGLTVGHYPQSIAISSVGGWVAARSAGQASAGYGVIEDLILGLVAVLPNGEVLRLRPTPRSAAGPDLRRLFAGSEGTLGVVTEVTLSASTLPEGIRWLAFRPEGFDAAIVLARTIARSASPLVLRAYDDADATLSFGGLGHPGGPVLIAGLERRPGLDAALDVARAAAQDAGADPLPDDYGPHWWEHRFDAVSIYRGIMGEQRTLGSGVVVDTMEVAGLWSGLPGLYAAVRDALAARAEAVGCHLSHPYRSGASLYYTFLVRAADDRAAEPAYAAAWADATRACIGAGGTITHHHGVGVLKAPFLEDELGAVGVRALRAIKRALDPEGLMNPGKLLPREPGA